MFEHIFTGEDNVTTTTKKKNLTILIRVLTGLVSSLKLVSVVSKMAAIAWLGFLGSVGLYYKI